MFNALNIRRALMALVLAACASVASAAGTLTITLDTSSYGSDGWIDISLANNPMGSVTTYATLTDFVNWGDSSTAQLSNVTGSLATGYTIENVANDYNDLFHAVNYSNGTVSFSVTFSGDADPTGLYGSSLLVSLYGADQTTLLGNSSSVNGSLVTVVWTPATTVGGEGSTVAQVLASGVTVATPVPEAQTWAMLAGGLALLGYMRRRKQA